MRPRPLYCECGKCDCGFCRCHAFWRDVIRDRPCAYRGFVDPVQNISVIERTDITHGTFVYSNDYRVFLPAAEYAFIHKRRSVLITDRDH